MKRFLHFLWIPVAVVFILLLLLLGSPILEKRENFETLKQEFNAKNIRLVGHSLALERGAIYYVSVGNPTLPRLLLIHGSPGDWTAWKKILLETSLLEDYHVIIPDRPPYQASTIKGGNLAAQSRAFKKIIEQECQTCTLVGHSYGGALALQLAVDYPQNIKAIISLAGTIAATHQTPKWYNYLAQKACISPFLSNSFKASNAEMISLSHDLKVLEKPLKQLDLPFFFLQGGEDVLVDPNSPFQLLSHLNELHIWYNSTWDHFIIWTEMETVAELIHRANK